MGLWDKVKHQLIDVIECTDSSGDVLVWKFPRYENEIKNGAQLIVREGQAAVFLHEGQLGDVFGPGRHELSTANIPVLTTLSSWKYGFNSPFKCDVFFVNMKQFTNRKWGTRNPIMLRDAEFGPIRLRAFGSYCFKVSEPGKFITQISGICNNFETNEITEQFTNLLVSRFADALGEAKIPALDLAANYNELGLKLTNELQTEFDEYGTKLTKFLIENISLPKNVEEALDKRSSMGVIGNMQQYTQYQTANAIDDMANNPNAGGNMMGMIAGVGMGNVMGGAINGAATQPATGHPAPPPIPQPVQWYVAINGEQRGPFDGKTIELEIANGTVKKDTLVWKQGMESWSPASSLPELASFFAQTPPPIPPPIP
jgi:membrane protease subunit (stomatin/prohibitin family)